MAILRKRGSAEGGRWRGSGVGAVARDLVQRGVAGGRSELRMHTPVTAVCAAPRPCAGLVRSAQWLVLAAQLSYRPGRSPPTVDAARRQVSMTVTGTGEWFRMEAVPTNPPHWTLDE